MATLTYRTVATSGQDGPLIQSLTLGQAATLAWQFTTNYPAFLQTAAGLVNQRIQQIETGEPEGQRNVLVIEGWGGQAGTAANAVNSRFQAGTLVNTDGSRNVAWPEYPHQIAWATSNGDTLTLRWIKGQPWAFILIGVLIVGLGYAVYRILTGSRYTLQTASPASGSGRAGSGFVWFGGSPFRIVGLPWYDALLATAGIVGGPYLYDQFARIYRDRASIVTSEQLIRTEEG